jgi:hypothetical protein
VNRYLTSITILVITLFFSACGGGSGDTFEDSSTKIIIIDCNNSNSEIGTNDCGDEDTPDYYTCLESGDTLIKEDENTIVEIVHDIDDNKKVCVQSGSAYILR